MVRHLVDLNGLDQSFLKARAGVQRWLRAADV